MGIIDNAREVVKVVQQIDNVELYRKILDLHSEIMKLVEENRNLKVEITRLTEALKIKESLQFQNDAYWTMKPDGTPKDGPFCSKCWDKERQLVRLIKMPNPDYSHCPSCKIGINVAGGRPRPITTITKFDPRRS